LLAGGAGQRQTGLRRPGVPGTHGRRSQMRHADARLTSLVWL